ncbi:histidine triad (HIT) protein [Endozoicomonas sp. (ex Bugula neritina AB1)]|nr:histidine triad (HIT) protein [Endozoicomonas sp. (ex Bugula neritina AB1)]
MFEFQLDSQLSQDTIVVGDFPLCRLLLMNDSTFPWFILVPRVVGIEEVYELDEEQQLQLSRESSLLSRKLQGVFVADKMNVAALGNIVRQLHVHHVVRYSGDPAWPAPVWGKLPAQAYQEAEYERVIEQLRLVLRSPFKFDE